MPVSLREVEGYAGVIGLRGCPFEDWESCCCDCDCDCVFGWVEVGGLGFGWLVDAVVVVGGVEIPFGTSPVTGEAIFHI